MTSHERHGVSNHRQRDSFCNNFSDRQQSNIKGPDYWSIVKVIHRSPVQVDALHEGPMTLNDFPCHDVKKCVENKLIVNNDYYGVWNYLQ